MGGVLSLRDQRDPTVHFLSEEYIHKCLPDSDDEENRPGNRYQLSADQLMCVLIHHPEFVPDKERILSQIIVCGDKLAEEISAVMSPLRKQFRNSQMLAQMRRIEGPARDLPEDVVLQDPLFLCDLCTFLFSKANRFPCTTQRNFLESLQQYSLDMYFMPPRREDLIEGPRSTGVITNPSVNVRGVAATGSFVFVLSHDMVLNVFPVLDNGSFLPGFSRCLNLDSNTNASLTATTDSLIVSVQDKEYRYDLIKATTKSEDPLDCEESRSIGEVRSYTDGIVNVVISSGLEARICLIGSSKSIHKVKISPRDSQTVKSLFNDMAMHPVEINGSFLSMFRRLNNGQVVWSQWSLLNGCHVGDQLINNTSGLRLEAIGHDSIHHKHWVVKRENGQLILTGYRSVGCINPFIFGFSYPKHRMIGETGFDKVVRQASLLLLSTLGIQPLPCFIMDSIDNVSVLLSMTMNILEGIGTAEKNDIPVRLDLLQLFVIILEMNIRYYSRCDETVAADLKKKIEFLLAKFLTYMNTPFGINLEAFLLLSFFDRVNCTSLADTIVEIAEGAVPSLFRYFITQLSVSKTLTDISIHEAGKFSRLFGWDSPDLHSNTIALLMTYQRVIVREAGNYLEKDMYSSIRLFNRSANRTPVDSLASYTQLIVNQVALILGSDQKVEELARSNVFQLFRNYLKLIWGLSTYHTISEAILPLLSVLPPTLHSYTQRNTKSNGINVFLSDMMSVLGFTFGLFAGTLMKGGDVSGFEHKYQWLIRPNISFMGKQQELENLLADLDEFDDPFVTQFLNNEKPIMEIIYKKWKPAINRRLSEQMMKLDRYCLISMCVHLNLVGALQNVESQGVVGEALKPALEQMQRVRSRAMIRVREAESIDTYFTKCRMLLRMAADLRNSTDGAKSIADYIISVDAPTSITQFIANQQIRLKLTNIGFSFVESIYSKDLGSLFYKTVAFSLAQIHDFDGLAAIMKYFDEKAASHIIQFVRTAIQRESPFLLLIAQKLIASNVLPYEITKELLAPAVAQLNSRCSPWAFALCYNHGIIGESENVADWNLLQWCLLANSCTEISCSLPMFHQILHFVLVCPPEKCRLVVRALGCAITGANPRPRTLKNDLQLLFKTIGQNIINGKNHELTSELVALFRRLLTLCNDLTSIIWSMIKQVTPESQDTDLVAVFAILGGFIEKATDNGCLMVHTSDRISRVVALGQLKGVGVEVPVASEAEVIPLSGSRYYAVSPVEFSPAMFPDPLFVFSFFTRAVESLCSPVGPMYLACLNYYLKDPDFSTYLDPDLGIRMAHRLSKFMNPIDNIEETIATLYKEMSKPEIQSFCGFEALVCKESNTITYLSPVLKCNAHRLTVNVTSEQCFSGFIGLMDESSYPNNAYLLLEIPSGFLYPNLDTVPVEVNQREITFGVRTSSGELLYGDKVIPFADRMPNKQFRIVVATTVGKLQSIEVPGIEKYVCDDQIPRAVILGYDRDLADSQSLYSMPREISSIANDGKKFFDFAKDIRACPPFSPLVSNTYDNVPMFPNCEIPIRSADSDEISPGMKSWACKQMYSRLYSQYATVAIMRLINNGLGPYMDISAVLRVFSMLLVGLEPCEPENLTRQQLPFSITLSSSHRDYVANALNFSLDSDARTCLNMIKCMKGFQSVLKHRISLMNASPCVHLLIGSAYEVVFYEAPMVTSPLVVESNDDCECYIGSVPMFNSLLALRRPNSLGTRFSALPQVAAPIFTNEFHGTIAVPLSFLKIHKHGNSWMLGTPFEMIILLREYLHCFEDFPFAKSILVDSLIVQSPFIFPLIPELLNSWAFSGSLPTTMPIDYKAKLVLLASFMQSTALMEDVKLISFLVQETRAITSALRTTLLPYFPEFTGFQHTIPQGKKIKIHLPPLNIVGVEDPFLTCLTIKAILAPMKTTSGLPFWDLFPLWLAVDDMVKGLEPKDSEELVVFDRKNNRIHIKNPEGKRCVFRMVPKLDRGQYAGAIVLTSLTADFAEPSMIQGDALFNPIEFSTDMLYMLLLNFRGGCDGVSIQFERKQAVAVTEMEIDPVLYRNDFLADMKVFTDDWNVGCTEALVGSLTSSTLKKHNFSAVLQCALDGHYDREMPRRVIGIVAHMVHQMNYIYKRQSEKVPPSFWDSVPHLLSSDKAMKRFMSCIIVRSGGYPRITINRIEARRIAVDGDNNPRMTIIGQFASQIARMSESDLQMRDPPWTVSFRGESAIDAGGPRCELFSEIADSIFQPTSKLFIPCPNGRNHCGPNRDTYVPIGGSQYAMQYKAIGSFLGIVIRNGFTQPLPFAPFVWNYLAGQQITASDVLAVDEVMRTLFRRIQEARNEPDFVERFALRWAVEDWNGTTVSLKATTAFVQGHEVNEYISLCIRHRIHSLQDPLKTMRERFYNNLGINERTSMNGRLLSLLAQGSGIVTTEQLKEITMFANMQHRQCISNYWTAVSRMSNRQRCLLVRFVTALNRLPNPRLKPNFRITVHFQDIPESRMPSAATCFNSMYLPCYSTAEIAFEKITYAIEACQTMDNA